MRASGIDSHFGGDPARLREEIQYMETRLSEIGFEGDCAYERAMSKFYQEQIETRKRRLAGLGDQLRSMQW